MIWRRLKNIFLPTFLALFSFESFALPSFKQSESDTNAILKADQIDGEEGVLTASGNVEVTKNTSTIYADEVKYYKEDKIIHGFGDVRGKNVEVGNMLASEVKIKDDFSSGEFLDSKIIFKDGSYLSSPKIERQSEEKTKLNQAFFSICPNDEIANDNYKAGEKRDMAAISSSSTVIDREDEMVRTKHGVFRLYNFPVFYIPYISIPLPAKKRESGFLHPSYVKTTNFGLGVKLPYYFNIAPNIDLLTEPQVSLTSSQVIIDNKLRHLTSYGKYEIDFELANNKLKRTQINSAVLDQNTSGLARRTDRELRWHLQGKGLFDFNKDLGLDFDINTVSDINYLRDYNFDFLPFTTSKVNLDHINKRDYYSIRSVRFQELQNQSQKDQAQLIIPEINTYTESKPFFSKEKFAFASNITNISPEEGVQYRRASFIPELKVPFNIKGNLFDFNAKLQADFYSLDNNFNGASTNNYDQTAVNYKPEASLLWRLPLIQKTKYNTWIFEPMASLVSSSYKRSNATTINQDSNDAELNVSNLFISDRISGFDRNESGERATYGFKTSLYNKLGEFGLMFGQSYRISNANQDVAISGFAANNKSNFVGQALYKIEKFFSIAYNFQLNEEDYQNEINQVTTSLNFDKFSLHGDYLLLKESQQNLTRAEQLALSSSFKLSSKWSALLSFNRDLELQRTISRSLSLNYDGCCTIFGFTVSETNPGSLVKPQRSFSINFTFKNL